MISFPKGAMKAKKAAEEEEVAKKAKEGIKEEDKPEK